MKDPRFVNLPSNMRQNISHQIYVGNKKQATKLFSEATGSDLYTAKQLIEQIEKELQILTPNAFVNKTTTQNSNLKIVLLLILVGFMLAGLANLLTHEFQKMSDNLGTQAKASTDENNATVTTKPEPNKAVVVDVKKPILALDKPVDPIDTSSPYQPLPEPEADLVTLYQEKLANPAYVARENLPFYNQGYQDFREEHLIKAKRAAIAKKLTAPAKALIFTIPKQTNLAIRIDGRMNKDEWKNALAIPLEPKETRSVVYLQRDEDWLYVAVDVPKDTTVSGFDQFRFYYHIGLDPAINNERIFLNGRNEQGANYESEQMVGGNRETNLKWQGTISNNENERWKKYPISDWRIYRLAKGAAAMNPNRQYEVKLHLKEIGLSESAPFTSFFELETDPVYEGSQFKNRMYLGELGTQEKPVWFKME